MQLALRTSFVRLHGPGYDRSQTGSRQSMPEPAAELQEADQIAFAIMDFYKNHTSGSSQTATQSTPEGWATKDVEDLVSRALRSFSWTRDHDLLMENTGFRQNFLHVCAIGDYQRLLTFFLDHGCGDRAKQDRRDYFGRTAVELAHAMGRETIEGMLTWGLERDKPSPDVRGSDISEQITYALGLDLRIVLIICIRTLLELARTWRELRTGPSEEGEVIWEPQPGRKWLQTPLPRFRRNPERLQVR